MASLSLYPQFETNLISNCKVIEFVLQLKTTKDLGKNYINVRPPLSAIFSVTVYWPCMVNIAHEVRFSPEETNKVRVQRYLKNFLDIQLQHYVSSL